MMFQVLHEQMPESASTPPKLGEPPDDSRRAVVLGDTEPPTKPQQRFDALASTAEALSSSLEPTEVLYQALEALMEITGVERAFLLMADPASGADEIHVVAQFRRANDARHIICRASHDRRSERRCKRARARQHAQFHASQRTLGGGDYLRVGWFGGTDLKQHRIMGLSVVKFRSSCSRTINHDNRNQFVVGRPGSGNSWP